MNRSLIAATTIALGLTSAASAQSTFTNAVDTDFNNAGNWSAGLPDFANGQGVISSGSTATMSADYVMINNGPPAVTDIVVNGTMNTGAQLLDMRSGVVGQTSDVIIGDAVAGGILNIDNGGRIQLLGAAVDFFVGINGGSGSLNILDGGEIIVTKSIEVIDGTMSVADGGLISRVQDELVIDDAGTLSMEIDAATPLVGTILGDTVAVELGATSTLNLDFLNTPTIGDSFDLITGISGYSGVAGGGTGTGVFGTVTSSGLASGQALQVNYGADTLSVEVVAVPEPASAALAALGLLAIAGRRRA